MIERFEVPVETRAPTGTTNSYLLDSTVLVDPAASTEFIGIDPERIEHVVVTHVHPDHVDGVATAAAETSATVWSKYGREDEFAEATGVEPDATVREGTAIGSTAVLVRETPGHTPDHVAFQVGREAVVGDVAMADTSVVIGAPEGDMRAYLTSLRRLRLADLSTAYPGHGRAIEEPTRRFTELLRHRLDRERRVLGAVQQGARTVEEIVSAAYRKDLTGVRDLASMTVRAHLDKLAVERRIEWDGAIARPP